MAKRYGDVKTNKFGEDAGHQAAGYYERPDMLDNDNSKPSNLPTEVMLKDYPSMDYLRQTGYPDDYMESDKIANSAVAGARKQNTNIKY